MYWEIFGILLLWSTGTIAIAEWFALRKMDMRYTQLENRYKQLLGDHARLLKEYSGQE